MNNVSTMTVTSIAQARLLADPLKLRIIQELATAARTTKQVAEVLGEKPTRLYRHVDALRDAGLIRLVEEKPKRGTVEKYFLAAAKRFEIHPDLFAAPNEGGAALLDDLLVSSYSEIRAAINDLQSNPPQDEDLQASFLKFSVRATEDDIKDLRKQLLAWLSRCQECEQTTAEGEQVQWSGFIAFHPQPPK